MLWKILLIFLLFSFGKQNASNVEELLAKIPIQERNQLADLFRELIEGNNFAYTLFGDKPISLGGDFIISPWENTIAGFKPASSFWEKWEAWEANKHLFSMSQFILIKEPSYVENVNNIILINKPAFIKMMYKYLDRFEVILKRKIVPEDFLNEIENGKSFVESIQNNDFLWGILLGFSEHNAVYYSQMFTIFNDRMTHFVPKRDIKLFRIRLPYFMVIENYETEYLRTKYAKMRGYISEIYASGDFLTPTVAQLISEKPNND